MPIVHLPTPEAAARWLRERSSGALRADSRAVRLGDAFIAWPGQATDGRRFVPIALGAGAMCCLVEADGVEAFGFDSPRIGALRGLKAAAGEVADLWYGQPSRVLDLVAATGTNGKTSTAWWTAQALSSLGRRCGVIGTLGIGEPPRSRAAGSEPAHLRTAGSEAPRSLARGEALARAAAHEPAQLESTGLTTPDPVRLHASLRRMVDAGFRACAIEASSIGVVEHRLAGLHIAVAQFTNFTQDHLDYHGTMDAYWDAKSRLFGWPGLRAAALNIDDEMGAELAAALAHGGAVDLWTCSTRGAAARLVAEDIGYEDDGLGFELREGAQSARVQTTLIGDYNAANLLAVIGALRGLGFSLADAANACAHATPVPGRMQRVGAGAPEVVVDYAHTPDALDKVLASLRPLAEQRAGRLWCVFGCGGNRDAGKRPLMGEIAARLADQVIVTSDNPRHEEPGAIIRQIVQGVAPPRAVEVIEDRRQAIAHAVLSAEAEDVVLIAGKGHEDYQEVGGERLPFSDSETAELALKRRDEVPR